MPRGDEIFLRISLIDNLARHGRWRGVWSGKHMNIQRSSSNVQRSRSAGKTNTTASGALVLQIERAGADGWDSRPYRRPAMARHDIVRGLGFAFPKPSARLAGPIYDSAKRTHFIFAEFLLYRAYSQKLMNFAGAFANGFVLEKRTHFGGV